MADVLDQPWDDDPMKKHYVRLNGWVQAGKRRKAELHRNVPKRQRRDLRLFTFCAAGAVDVFTMHLEEIISERDGLFSNVSFCERDEGVHAVIGSVLPGAVAFFGEFEQIVILNSEEQTLASDPTYDPLDAKTVGPGAKAKEVAHKIDRHRRFLTSFPYDILNLDFCGYFYKNAEPHPGSLFKALRRIFRWQRDMVIPERHEQLGGFTLLFTTQIGPDNLNDDYKAELIGCLRDNLEKDESLREPAERYLGTLDLDLAMTEKQREFFCLALPKILIKMLEAEDWHVDANEPFQVFEFQRQRRPDLSYTMLHIVMQVRRQSPPRDDRGFEVTEAAQRAYRTVVRSLFESGAIDVDARMTDEVELQLREHLTRVEEDAAQYRA